MLRVVIVEAEGDSVQPTLQAALALLGGSGQQQPAALAAPAAAVALPPPQPQPQRVRAAKSRGTTRRQREAAVAERPARASAAAPAPAARPEPAAGESAAASPDGTVSVAGTVIAHGGRSITLTPREAQMAEQLAKVMPNVADRDRLAQQLWGRVDDSTRNMVGQVARSLHESVTAIGLKVTSLRGVGVVMAEAG